MTLSTDQVKSLASFIGYGNPHAKLWFVGAEEGLGGAMTPEEVSVNLLARSEWNAVMDMHAAHQTLRERGQFIDISRPRRGSTTVWQFMSKIARAFEGACDFMDGDRATEYKRTRLGCNDGNTFLTELLPFPSQQSARPTDLANFGNEKDITGYLAERERKQLEILPSGATVVCYGFGKRKQFANRFGIEWQECSLPVRSGSRPDHRVKFFKAAKAATQNKFILLPFFGNGAMSNDFLRQVIISQLRNAG